MHSWTPFLFSALLDVTVAGPVPHDHDSGIWDHPVRVVRRSADPSCPPAVTVTVTHYASASTTDGLTETLSNPMTFSLTRLPTGSAYPSDDCGDDSTELTVMPTVEPTVTSTSSLQTIRTSTQTSASTSLTQSAGTLASTPAQGSNSITPASTQHQNVQGPLVTGRATGSKATSINEAFVARGKNYFASCADQGDLNESGMLNLMLSDFGGTTPENSMKWDETEPANGTFTFEGADYIANWASENGKVLRCHNLVWHAQLPNWVSNINNPAQMQQAIENHIAVLAGRYAGKCYAWDVLNEVFGEDGNLEASPFYNVLGESFVRIAFEAARKADPYAKLYINDFNLDSATYPKTIGLAAKVKEWVAQGIPIDGIGSQSHLGSGVRGTQAALELLAGSVSEVAITELDITGAAPADYVEVVSACLNTEKCVGITVWGADDGNSWRSQNDPTLFYANFQPKPAYEALMEMLNG